VYAVRCCSPTLVPVHPEREGGRRSQEERLAERAAWDFVSAEGGGIELSVINPAGIFGPVLGSDHASSIQLVKSMLEGKVPAVPRLYFGVVDVRDVADLVPVRRTAS
jgi:nucleoside-diphosphate-sugar epimerase